MEQQVVSAYEYLKQQGQTFVVFHPTEHLLYLGFGCEDSPRVVPHCIAENTSLTATAADGTAKSARTKCTWQLEEKSFEALAEVQKALHLPVPPRPPCLDTHQQQQQRPSSLDPPGSQAADQSAADQPNADMFPAAKARLVSSRSVAEGSDGFAWANVRRGSRTSHAGQQQQQQQQQQQAPSYVPCMAGTQVAALWPGEPYRSHWLMTADGHIAGLDTTPEHVLLERFEAVWRWALSVELRLTAVQIRQLSAVLLVHHEMTAVEVRLLADLLLERLGFASLVVHLQPVAATFGNSATSACIIDMGSSSTSICCVDDAVVLPPASSRLQLDLGLTQIAAALVGWMSCYGHWPAQLQQADGGPNLSCVVNAEHGASAGSNGCCANGSGNIYGCLMLEELVMQQCYFPKETLTLGLVGQAMLEEQPPALVPLRSPGSQTVNFQISLGSWAAVAAMLCFYPDLAPTQQQLLWYDNSHSSSQHVNGKAVQADTSSSSATEGNAQTAAASSNSESHLGLLYKRYHACVHDMPGAESMYLQGQLKARVEAGDATAPPVGMYLPPLDMPAAAGGADGDDDNTKSVEPATRHGSMGNLAEQQQLYQRPDGVAAASVAADAADAANTNHNMSLDEAVYQSIMAVASHRPELLDRLANGLLLTGPAAGLRGLGQMLERRLMQRFSYGGRQQVVNVLVDRAHPSHTTWKGGALLAALDSTRDNWLPRHQWVAGGMVLPPPAAQTAASAAGPNGTPGPGAGTTLATAAAGRHAKLFYYCKAESGF